MASGGLEGDPARERRGVDEEGSLASPEVGEGEGGGVDLVLCHQTPHVHHLLTQVESGTPRNTAGHTGQGSRGMQFIKSQFTKRRSISSNGITATYNNSSLQQCFSKKDNAFFNKKYLSSYLSMSTFKHCVD